METKQSILYKLNQNEVNTGLNADMLDGVSAEKFIQSTLVNVPDATNTLALTAALHANKVVYVLDATLAVTLPEATGTGNVYTIILGIDAATGGAGGISIVTADTTNCHFRGFVNAVSDTPGALAWPALAGTPVDTVTLNAGSKGGLIGDKLVFTDIATDIWQVGGSLVQSGTEATPFSNAA
jgi:hypothetical protein